MKTRYFSVSLDANGQAVPRCLRPPRPTELISTLKPEHACAVEETGGGFIVREFAEEQELWSELGWLTWGRPASPYTDPVNADLFPFDNSMMFPIPRSTADPRTGLFPYVARDFMPDAPAPLSETISNPLQSPSLCISCSEGCHNERIRVLSASRGELSATPYRTRYSRVKLPASEMDCARDLSSKLACLLPREGLWTGTYSAHGVEVLLFRYFSAVPTEHLPGSFPEDEQPIADLCAIKVTGDPNVPKGELTLRASILPSTARRTTIPLHGEGEAELNLLTTTEFAGYPNLNVVPAEGTVAMAGFRRPRPIAAYLIVLNEGEAAVWWPALHKISRFAAVDLDM